MVTRKTEKKYTILSINPGSTTTKAGIHKNKKKIAELNISHNAEKLREYSSILDQYEFRYSIIRNWMKENSVKKIHAVVARGGLIQPVPGGTYRIDDEMIQDLRESEIKHASNLGALIAMEFSKEFSIPSYIVDPVVVDEMQNLARYSGHPSIRRYPIFHALNQKATAKRYSEKIGKDYKQLNLIVCHMGGGITVGAHKKGRVIDVNNALTGEGPFTPERSGALPCYEILQILKKREISIDDAFTMLRGESGLTAYTGSSDLREIRKQIHDGKKEYQEVIDAMVYQIAKEIGSLAAVLKGEVDQIILTGGIANDYYVINALKKYTRYISKITVYPGEDELLALTEGALSVLQKKEKARRYKKSIIARQ